MELLAVLKPAGRQQRVDPRIGNRVNVVGGDVTGIG
jgi:hypothetical protein